MLLTEQDLRASGCFLHLHVACVSAKTQTRGCHDGRDGVRTLFAVTEDLVERVGDLPELPELRIVLETARDVVRLQTDPSGEGLLLWPWEELGFEVVSIRMHRMLAGFTNVLHHLFPECFDLGGALGTLTPRLLVCEARWKPKVCALAECGKMRLPRRKGDQVGVLAHQHVAECDENRFPFLDEVHHFAGPPPACGSEQNLWVLSLGDKVEHHSHEAARGGGQQEMHGERRSGLGLPDANRAHAVVFGYFGTRWVKCQRIGQSAAQPAQAEAVQHDVGSRQLKTDTRRCRDCDDAPVGPLNDGERHAEGLGIWIGRGQTVQWGQHWTNQLNAISESRLPLGHHSRPAASGFQKAPEFLHVRHGLPRLAH